MAAKTKAALIAAVLLPGGLLVLGLYLILVLFGGEGSAGLVVSPVLAGVALLPARARVREALRAASLAHGLDPAFLDAIGWVESRWRLGAVNDSPSEVAAVGGSYGPTQISRRTLARNGYPGGPEDLTTDPELAAEWSARLLVAGALNAQGQPLAVTPATLADAVAWWNAGKQVIENAPPTTQAYLARAQAAADGAPELA